MEEDVVVTLMTGKDSTRRDQLNAGLGSSVVIGSCSCVECGADLVLGARPGAWFRAVVTVCADHWRLDNLSLDAEAWLVDLENPELKVSAAPGRRQLVVPFEFADLSFRVGRCDAGDHVTVIGPEVTAEVPDGCRLGAAALAAIDLRPGTTYLAVLETLCAGASASGFVPSSASVAQRLRERGLLITPKAVDHHVDYLFQRCFPGQGGRARGWKRLALVSLFTRAASRD